jgi:hypothetical protein
MQYLVNSICRLNYVPLSGPQTNWRSPDNANGNGSVDAPPVSQAKSTERPKQAPKTNGFREEHNHRGNGYISITGTCTLTPWWVWGGRESRRSLWMCVWTLVAVDDVEDCW